MKAGELLKFGWMIANVEAKRLGAAEILPIHFLLAAMKIIDPKFPDMLDSIGISTASWSGMCKEAASLRNYMDVLPERVALKRRRLRSRLAAQSMSPPVEAEGMLHRSGSLKKAFSDACMLAEGDTLTLKKLIESLFELELVSLDDIDK